MSQNVSNIDVTKKDVSNIDNSKKDDTKKDDTKKDDSKKDDSKKDDSKKEIKIPNSLIIYIKTRIPNYSKVTYEPFMTVPKNKSHTIYFEPLVKYYESPIINIPSGAPKETLYTQFFQAAEFDSMINRILSDFRYMQKPRTLQQATEEHIIDNNIKLTLANLFKSNNLFYIDKKPYTIVDHHWKDSNWQIDKKPIEKLLNQFSNMSVNEIEKQAKNEEDDIPEILRQGNVASSNLTREENMSSVASGLQASSNKPSLIRDDQQLPEAFVSKKELPGVKKYMKKLFTKYLKENSPINFSDTHDLARDPLTLSILIDPSVLLKFINETKNSDIFDSYLKFINVKKALLNADEKYKEMCIELLKYNTFFSENVASIKKQVDDNSNTLKREVKHLIIDTIKNLKIDYMKFIFNIADAINEIYVQQKIYFIATKSLLEVLKNNYEKIIKYYDKPELGIKCIEYDINVIDSLIQNDKDNPYSNSYFLNKHIFTTFYEKKLKANKKSLLEPIINYKDEEYYFNDIGVLFIEKQQYELYTFKMFLFYLYNQFDIWVSLFKSIQIFTKYVGTQAYSLLQTTEVSLKKYNEEAVLNPNFIKNINSFGVKAEYNKLTQKVDWYLVKKDGSRYIEPVKKWTSRTDYDNSVNAELEKLYISSIKSQSKSYDAIMLYIYLLEVTCLRQNRVYVSEENVNQLNLEFSQTSGEYYYSIERSITENKGNKLYIPKSLLWNTTEFTNMSVIEKEQKKHDKFSIIYRGRLKTIQNSRDKMLQSCEAIEDIITPNLSETGFVDKCQTLLDNNLDDITEYSFRSSYWLKKTIENYNNKVTSDFIYNIDNVIQDAWHNLSTEDKTAQEYLDWMVFNNSGTKLNNTQDSIYASISDALNGQLDIDGNTTTNPYTELIEIENPDTENTEKVSRFTVSSLKKLVSDINNNNEEKEPVKIMAILQKTLKINFIVFEMFPRETSEIQLGDMVKYKNQKYRVIRILKDDKNTPIYTLDNNYKIIDNIFLKNIKLTSSNLNTHFRLNCETFYINQEGAEGAEDTEDSDNIYLVLTKLKNKSSQYRLVKNTSNNNFIVQTKYIPVYIKYFIYNYCYRFITKNIPNNGSFKKDFANFTTIIEKRLEKERITNDMTNITAKLQKTQTQYNNLNKKFDKSQEEETQSLLLETDIKQLKEQLTDLNNLLKEVEVEDVDEVKKEEKVKDTLIVPPNVLSSNPNPAVPSTSNPVVPASNPVVPASNPVVPSTSNTDLAVPSASNPVVPASNPVVPASNPVVPSASNPVVPASNPVVPSASNPVVPSASNPVVPASNPVVPASNPVVPSASNPVVPSASNPVVPASNPVVPSASNPVVPASNPDNTTGTIITSTDNTKYELMTTVTNGNCLFDAMRVIWNNNKQSNISETDIRKIISENIWFYNGSEGAYNQLISIMYDTQIKDLMFFLNKFNIVHDEPLKSKNDFTNDGEYEEYVNKLKDIIIVKLNNINEEDKKNNTTIMISIYKAFIAEDRTWGGEPEIQTLANVLNKPVRMLNMDDYSTIIFEPNSNRKIEKGFVSDNEQIILYYNGTNHYQYLQKLEQTGGDPTKPSEITKPSEMYTNLNNQQGIQQGVQQGIQKGFQQGIMKLLSTRQMKNIPYSVSQNKAKDVKSKLSFYITIELELFPGESANVFQKSVIKCQSTFERIREAYAEIRGFQYRPADMNESYDLEKNDLEKNDLKKSDLEKNDLEKNDLEKNDLKKNNLKNNRTKKQNSSESNNSSTRKNR
jgi:hypothetical protein